MNRRNIIIWSLIAVAVITAVSIVLYVLSFRTVTFTIIPDTTITIYNQESEEVGQLDTDGSLRLQDGVYTVVPAAEDFSKNPIPFTVEGRNITVTVDPNYSSEYLEELLRTEQAAINKVLRDTYPDIIDDFTLIPGKLYQKGEWYAGLVIQKPLGGGQLGDVYRVVLKKEEDTWTIQAKPGITLSARDYPNIPYVILSDVNAQERP